MTPKDGRSSSQRRKRSRSPARTPERSSHPNKRRHRSGSRHNLDRRHHQQSNHEPIDSPSITLPFNARPLSKHDLGSTRPILGLYLDIQKQLAMEDLTSNEVRGRWKSFVRKWNGGELAEGWYDPKTHEKARNDPPHKSPSPSPVPRILPSSAGNDSDDSYGPRLPVDAREKTAEQGDAPNDSPARVSMQNLQVTHETAAEEAEERRRLNRESLRAERRADGRLQKERLDEIAPRAAAGTRERQIEKKREKADSNRAFAASAHDNAEAEVQDSEMMGDGDGIDEFKRMKQSGERKRSERQTRREEQLAARRADREERVQAMKEREGETMGLLKDIARARFGA